MQLDGERKKGDAATKQLWLRGVGGESWERVSDKMRGEGLGALGRAYVLRPAKLADVGSVPRLWVLMMTSKGLAFSSNKYQSHGPLPPAAGTLCTNTTPQHRPAALLLRAYLGEALLEFACHRKFRVRPWKRAWGAGGGMAARWDLDYCVLRC